MTPFLTLVVVGFAAFMVVLSAGWILDVRHEMQLKKSSGR